MSSDEPPRLFTYKEWRALTDDQREAVAEQRRQDVDAARRAHAARRRLNDALTVERFGRQE